MNTIVAELLSKLNALTQENATLKTQVEHYHQQHQAFSQNVANAKQKIVAYQESLQQRNTALQAEKQKFAQQREQFVKQFQVAKKTIIEQKLQLEKEKVQLSEQKQVYSQIQLKIQTLRATYQQQEQQFIQQRQVWVDLVATLKQKYLEQETAARKQYDEQISQKQKVLTQYQQNIDAAHSAHLTISAEYEAKHTQLTELAKQIEQVQARLNESEQLLADQKETLVQYRADIQNVREQQENITRDCEEKYLQVVEFKEQVQYLQIEKNSVELQLKIIRQSINEQQANLIQYDEKLAIAQAKEADITQRQEEKNQQVATLETQLVQLQDKLIQTEHDIEEQKIVLSQYHEDIAIAREQREDIVQSCEEKRLQLIDFKNELNQIQADKNAAQEELVQIKKSILEQKILLQQYSNTTQEEADRQPENVAAIVELEDKTQPENIAETVELKNEMPPENIAESVGNNETVIEEDGQLTNPSTFTSSRPVSLRENAHQIHTPFSQWLSNFLLQRDFMPDGRVLFRYLMDEDEYAKLCALFGKNNRVMRPSNARYQEWCACYCIAVSEIYRREYSSGSWSWDLIDQILKVSFTQVIDRYPIIAKGMEYWKRDVQRRESDGNHQYLGTLFAECGLPMKLLTAENNHFSNLIKYGLEKYAESQQTYRPLTQFLQDKRSYLPEVFRNSEATIELLAETVRVLMDLAQTFDLSKKVEPVAYLDSHAVNWRQRFPFVLPEQQADDLIHHWLSDAAKEQSKSAKQQFSCTHYVETEKWQLMADFRLPEIFAFTVPTHYSGCTILQWALFEGETPVAQDGGTIFATLNDGALSFKLPEQHSAIARRQPDFPLSVRLFADGQWLFTQMLPETQIDMQLPCVFLATTENKWKLVANADYIQVNSENYLLRLPADFRLPENEKLEIIEEKDNVIWLKANSSLKITHIDGHDIHIVITQNAGQAVSLNGKVFDHLKLADGSGAPIYRGFPNIHTPEHLPCTHVRIDGKDFSPRNMMLYGTFQAAFYSNQTCLLRRKITVLPADFILKWDRTAQENQAAKISFRLPENLFCQVHGENLEIKKQEFSFELKATHKQYPTYVIARLGSEERLATSLRITFLFNGAYLSDDEGLIENKKLNLNQLLGKTVLLHTTQSQVQMQWTLQPENIQRTFMLPVGQDGLQLHLHQLKAQLTQLLACSSNQDAKIIIAFKAQHNTNAWLALEIARYNGVVQWNNQHYQFGQLLTLDDDKNYFVIKKQYDDEYAFPNVTVNIMRLDAPEFGWQTLPESDLMGNHRYTVPSETYGEGLWLIYPAEDSPIQFRPTIFDNSETPLDVPECIDSLSIAARVFHPESYPQIISQVISKMATQPEHEGWQYFLALQKHFSHLPLSVFETWKELARQPESLAMAVLRLGLDGAFCERIRQELAVVWEWQPAYALSCAIKHFQSYYDKQMRSFGLDPKTCPLMVDVIPMSIVCHSEILRQHIFKGYLDEEKAQLHEQNVRDILQISNQEIAKSFYLNRYNDLRKRAQKNFRLPETLCEPLQSWLDGLPPIQLTQYIRDLSKTSYDRAVVWLPIFTAYVKANQSKPSDLMPSENQTQLLDAFYQVYSLDPDWFDYICTNITSLLISESKS